MALPSYAIPLVGGLAAGRDSGGSRPYTSRSEAATPLTAAGHILTTARQLEEKVAGLKGEADQLRAEQERRAELSKAGMPMRNIAAADCAREKVQQAAQSERTAREAGSRAFAGRKALEQTLRECTSRVKLAEDSARRSEEELAEAERAIERWRQSAEIALADARERHAFAVTLAQRRLDEVQGDAEKRAKLSDENLASERQRVDDVLRLEQEKADRQYALQANAADAQREKAQLHIKSADAAADIAGRQHDREAAAAAYRAGRSLEAAESKLRQAHTSLEGASERTALRLEQAHDEKESRLEAARAREAWAIKDHERRVRDAEARMVVVEQVKTNAFKDCEEEKRLNKERLAKLRKDLAAKTAAWEAAAREAEETSRQKVADVQKLAEMVRAALKDEVQTVAANTEASEAAANARLQEHKRLCEGSLGLFRGQTEAARQLAKERIATAEQLTEQHLAEKTALGEAAVEQARSGLDLTRGLVEGRVREAAGHLMTYLDHGEAEEEDDTKLITSGLDLELWIPLPGGYSP